MWANRALAGLRSLLRVQVDPWSGRPWPSHLAVIVLGCAAAGMIICTTANGTRAGSDSVAYMVGARNLLAGEGLGWRYPSGEFRWLTHFPPLYPVALSGFGAAGVDPLDASRGISTICYGLFVVISAGTILRATGSWRATAATAILHLGMGVYIRVFSSAMSEPLFLVLQAVGVFELAEYLRGSRARHAVVAGLSFGLAAITRYIGLALLGGAALSVLVLSGNGLRKRAVDAGLLFVIGLLPSVGWLVCLAVNQGVASPRQVHLSLDGAWALLRPFRGGLVDGFWEMVPILGGMNAGGYRNRFLLLVVMLVAGGTLAWHVARIHRKSEQTLQSRGRDALNLAAVGVVLAVPYVAGLATAALFARPAPDIDARMLIPVRTLLPQSIVAGLCLWGILDGRLSWLKGAAVIVTTLGVLVEGPATAKLIASLHEGRDSYSSPAWKESCLIQAVEETPMGIPLISSDSAALLFQLGRDAYDIPELLDLQPRRPFGRFGEDPENEVEALFRDEGAALVLFKSAIWRFKAVYGEEAEARLSALVDGLDIWATCYDGDIFLYPSDR